MLHWDRHNVKIMLTLMLEVNVTLGHYINVRLGQT